MSDLQGDTCTWIDYPILSMTLIERIIDGVRDLPQRDQVKVANLVFRLNPRLQQQQADMLRRLHGVLSEEDGLAFEQAMEGSRRMEGNG